MRSVRPVVVVEFLPGGQLLLEIDVIAISEELVELVLVGAMRPLDLPPTGLSPPPISPLLDIMSLTGPKKGL